MIYNRRLLPLVFLGIMAAEKSAGQIITDRPDITESAYTIPENSVQIEAGILFERSLETSEGSIPGRQTISLPEILLRYGLFPFLELRAGSELVIQKSKSPGISENSNGLTGLYIGTKIQLLRDLEEVPDAAVFFHLHLPAGAEKLRPEKPEPEILLAASHGISGPFSISYNIGSKWETADDLMNYFYSSSLSVEFSKTGGFYSEFFGNISRNIKSSINFDAGFIYLLNNNLQLDIFSGINFKNPLGNWFAGSGISFLFYH